MLRRALQLELLENRRYLAVTPSFSATTGTLTIAGDSTSEEVLLQSEGSAGQVGVFVTGQGPLGTYVGVRTLRINLGGGNDILTVAAINIGGDLSVNMGSGADEFTIINTGTIAEAPVFIGGSVIVNMGNNANDYFVIDSEGGLPINIGRDLRVSQVADVTIVGGLGSSRIDAGDITIGGNLSIALSGLGDANGNGVEVLLDDVNVGGNTTLKGSAANDRMRFLDCAFSRRVAINLGSGNDRVSINEGPLHSSRFSEQFLLNGGTGTDTFERGADNFFATLPKLTAIELVV